MDGRCCFKRESVRRDDNSGRIHVTLVASSSHPEKSHAPHQRLCNVASLCDVFAVLFIRHTDPLFCYHLPAELSLRQNIAYRITASVL